jgi:beta-lactamase regulating signal transducer with metallopeptidase domain
MIARTLGWTLIHSTWEIAVIGLLFLLLTLVLRRSSSKARYAVALCAMAMCLVLPASTFILLKQSEPNPHQPISQSMDKGLLVAQAKGATPTSVGPALNLAPAMAREAEAESVSKRIEPMLPKVVLVWLVGLLAMCVRLAGGLYSLHRLKRTASPELDDKWKELTESVASRIGLKRSVSILFSDRIESPAVIGFLKSVVLFPVNALARLSPGQVEALIAHEVAHIRRHDMLVNLFQSLIETVLFYHPAVWWISSVVRSEREHCCDDLAIQATGDRAVYAKALVCLEEMRLSPRMAMAANRGSLVVRIRRIVEGYERSSAPTPSAIVILLFASLSLALAQSLKAHPVANIQSQTIEGVVTDSNGMPAPGASVFLETSSRPNWYQTKKYITDEIGRFRFELPRTSNFWLLAHQTGKGIACKLPEKSGIQYALKLKRGQPFNVRVTDQGGLPIQGLRVYPTTISIGIFGFPVTPEVADEIAETTDARGKATLSYVEPLSMLQMATLDHRYAKPLKRWPEANGNYIVSTTSEVTLMAHRSSELRGVVTDNGRGVSGVEVIASSKQVGGNYLRSITGPTGRFEFDQVLEGTYTISSARDDKPLTYKVVAPQRVTLREGQVKELSIPLVPGTIVRSKIEQAGSQFAQVTQVRILKREWPDYPGYVVIPGPDGKFSIRLPEGNFQAHLLCGAVDKVTDIEVRGGKTQQISLEGPKVVVIRAKVIDEDGKPVTGIGVQYFNSKAPPRLWPIGAIDTDDRGEGKQYYSEDESKGLYFKAQSWDQFSDPRVFPKNGYVLLKLHQMKLAGITGSVRDANGTPISKASVRIALAGPADFIGNIQDFNDFAQTHPDGSFRLHNLYPGLRLRITAQRKGYRDAVTGVYVTKAGSELAIPDINLKPLANSAGSSTSKKEATR